MTAGLDVLDTTLQQTNLWLKDLMHRLGTENRKLAYRVRSRRPPRLSSALSARTARSLVRRADGSNRGL